MVARKNHEPDFENLGVDILMRDYGSFTPVSELKRKLNILDLHYKE